MNYIKITSLDDKKIDLYTNYSEPQLLHVYEPELGVFIAESPEVIDRALNAGYEPISFLVEEENLTSKVEKTMDNCNVPIYIGPHHVLKDIPGYGLTRGMLCAFRRRPIESVPSLINTAANIAILEDVMNPTNIGAIIRSAAALGIDALLLTAGCADPLYRRAARVSMGTVFQVPWTYFDKHTLWPNDGIESLKAAGYTIIATALTDNTIDIRDSRLSLCPKKAIILGTEGTGIKSETLSLCDYTVKIPMSHDVDSLNVSAASAVTFWEFTRSTLG